MKMAASAVLFGTIGYVVKNRDFTSNIERLTAAANSLRVPDASCYYISESVEEKLADFKILCGGLYTVDGFRLMAYLCLLCQLCI